MAQWTVSISDARVSADPADTLVTYSLGSCVGVAAYDPVARVGGLLHYQLPTASMDPARASQSPCMFADTGLNMLFELLRRAGAVEKRLRITLAGAAQIIGDGNMFNIGRRNHAAARKILWQRGLLIAKEDVGGTTPRTVYLSIADGTVTIRAGGRQLAAA